VLCRPDANECQGAAVAARWLRPGSAASNSAAIVAPRLTAKARRRMSIRSHISERATLDAFGIPALEFA